jgi:hypothetical protein
MNAEQNKPEERAAGEGDLPELKPIGPTPMGLPELVERLEELVKFSLEFEQKPLKEGVSFVTVYKQLQDIRRAIEVLSKDQQFTLSLIEEASKDQKELPINKEGEKLLNKIGQLKETCEAARERAHAALQEQPGAEELLKEQVKEVTTSKKKKVARRKGKFRRVGGKKGWMPT